jgi:hypothetical protein
MVNIFNLTLFSIEVLLAIVCLVGDYYVFKSLSLINLFLFKSFPIFNEILIRALLDNFVHGIIGLISWLIIIYPNLNLNELVASYLFSSILDIDHFINAKSFKIAEAISLQKRPFLHNSLTLLLVNSIIFLTLAYFTPAKKNAWTILFFISWFSHHCRDGTRHGLWFGFMGSSMPINNNFYLLIILLMPLLFRFILVNNFNFMDLLYFKQNENNKIVSHIV